MNNQLVIFSIIAGIAALLFAAFKSSWINRQDQGTDVMKEIGQAVREGAMAFLAREYKVLSAFVLVVILLLAVMNEGSLKFVALSFVVGAFCSALAGFLACVSRQPRIPVRLMRRERVLIPLS